MNHRFLAATLALAASTALSGRAGAGNELPRFPTIATVAGTGAAGVLDDAAATSEFMMPTSVAQDTDGTIFVADAMAERIRAILPDGRVRTVAGGGEPSKYLGLFVQGGYNDGPALLAHFYVPIALAIDGRHRIFIADNHCIRKLERAVVTTFAGSCVDAGDRGGALLDARFGKPVALAVDRSGDLYIADELHGIREATADGTVRDIDLPVDRPSGISLWESDAGTTLGVADANGIVLREPSGNVVRVPLRNTPANPFLQGDAPLGYPFGLVLTGPASAVYTDPRTHTLRYLANHGTRVLAGDAHDDVENDGGGFRDGVGSQALFAGPMGIARARDGGFLVADAGNRRVRRVSAFDERGYASPIEPGAPFPDLDASTYNVLVVGNSFAWFDTDWQTSVSGVLQARLERAGIGRPVRVVALPAMTLPATASYFRESVAYRPIDLIVMLVNSSTIQQAYPPQTFATAAYVKPMTLELGAIRATLPKAHFLVALHPYPWQVSTTESIYHRFFELTDDAWLNISPAFHDQLLAVSHGANLDTLDLWPAFAAAERTGHAPLFGTVTYHFTPAGRALAANAIADYLVSETPWRK